MEMKHCLPCGFAVCLVQRQAFRGKCRSHRAGDLNAGTEKRAGLGLVQVIDILGVRFRRNQHMARVDLADIHERKRMLILVHDGCGYLLRNNPAEYAVGHPSPPASW